MPKLIDADKLLEWCDSEEAAPLWEGEDGLLKYGLLTDAIERMSADPTPVQPDIKPGDKVIHRDKRYEHYGVGIVKEIAKSGKQAYVEWPNYDKQHFKVWGPPTPAYYRLDKLEVIK